MPDTKYISRAQHTRAGGVSPAETDREARQGGGITQQHSTGQANTNTSQDDAALGTSDGSKHLHRAHGGVTLSSLAVGRCETFDEEGGQTRELQSHGESVKEEIDDHGTGAGATGSRCKVHGDGVRAKKPEGPIWGGLRAVWMGKRDNAGLRRASSDRPGPPSTVMAHLPWAETARGWRGPPRVRRATGGVEQSRAEQRAHGGHRWRKRPWWRRWSSPSIQCGPINHGS